MLQLHQALETLRPKDFGEVPLEELSLFLSDIFSKAELIANSVPPPPNGAPYESSQRSRSDANCATSAADMTVSQARRPPPQSDHEELRKAWGKPLKMSAKDSALGISVFKMAGHDRHGAWFARSSVHEGLGFAKWKRAMLREFPESLAVEGGPGEGNVRGIGGDRRLEDVDVDGVGRMEVYQLSAQFPGPTSPREFITLLLTSDNCLSNASKVGNTIPRHYMVVSIPVTHPQAPPRNGLVRGYYESVEMIREIPLASSKVASTSNLLQHEAKKSRHRGSTIGFAESRGPGAKGEKIDRRDGPGDDDPERNPVEWIMITRSDPGGGIPRFMVERNTPSSIVQDAGKFLEWACSRDDFLPREEDEEIAEESIRKSVETERNFSIFESNGILAGIGTSIADKPTWRRHSSHNAVENGGERPGSIRPMTDAVEVYLPNVLNPLQRIDSHSSSSTSSSIGSFASAEQFNTAPEGLPVDNSMATPSTMSEKSMALSPSDSGGQMQNNQMSREFQKIEQKRQQLKDRLDQARERQSKESQEASLKSAKELEKATERHSRERKKQEDRFAKEVQKLEQRRERETKKLLARQQKEADKNTLLKTQRDRDDWKEKAGLAEQENRLLKEQIGDLQRENTALVARIGKTEIGLDLLKKVREEMDGKSRKRASSRASAESRASRNSAGGGGRRSEQRSEHSMLAHEETT
ncbi:uncharacterized protein BDR25DRAFT_309331 [Lindgomyces ingoldianus]|uniref:Uncharacterized protein n=1 Tax=Lindgomyces ingoldianus TaxID=673940 RepID=A0ACB6RE67_9PLEO|nr:uncharacterized protein BDR25DRAFT_309331 [Lindgomyces ingoldianus]KAF2477010.1 hypothetical protein BDR25DRAFT_309331 [Lindgomyces ingoldianus]